MFRNSILNSGWRVYDVFVYLLRGWFMGYENLDVSEKACNQRWEDVQGGRSPQLKPANNKGFPEPLHPDRQPSDRDVFEAVVHYKCIMDLVRI